MSIDAAGTATRPPKLDVVACRRVAMGAVDVEQVDGALRPRSSARARAAAHGGRGPRRRRGARLARNAAKSSSPLLGVGSDLLRAAVAAAVGIDRDELHAVARPRRASTIVERPRNEPISTIRPRGAHAHAAASHRRRGLRVGQPALDALDERPRRVREARSRRGGGALPTCHAHALAERRRAGRTRRRLALDHRQRRRRGALPGERLRASRAAAPSRSRSSSSSSSARTLRVSSAGSLGEQAGLAVDDRLAQAADRQCGARRCRTAPPPSPSATSPPTPRR